METSVLVALLIGLGAAPAKITPLSVPDGQGGIGFDDLLFSTAAGKVLVPSGRTGRLNLLDPKTQQMDSVSGFSSGAASGEGHGEGTTSADVGHGFAFASDRSRQVVAVVDLAKKAIASEAKLSAGPDYVRWVEPTGEVWVTEPRAEAIELFRFVPAPTPRLERVGSIPIPGGPESLVVDVARGHAYTHTWKDATVVVDLKSRKEVARWPNGCEGSRGIALDGARGLLFVGCDEGKATALDVTHGGRRVGEAKTGKGVDIIAYAPKLRHLYVPGGDDATLTVLEVGERGQLTPLGQFATAEDAHCVAADDRGNAYVCDPKNGRLLFFHDTLARP